jgi:hypothetical protein
LNHEYQTKIYYRTYSSSGCPKCSFSKGETAIREYLVRRQIPHKPQWGQRKAGLPSRYAFDFAVNRNGAFWLIEYHGQQHYRPINFGSKKDWAKYRQFIDAIRRDDFKKRWCRDRHKNLLVIPFWEFDRVEAILDQFFMNKEPAIAEPPEVVKKYEPMRQRIMEVIDLGPKAA